MSEVLAITRTHPDIPTSEEYAYALAENESFQRRTMIRIGRLGDPLYRFEAWAELQVYNFRNWSGAKLAALDAVVTARWNSFRAGLAFVLGGHSDE
jgi:hypothetical protein